ncbi:MAG TPA: tryptophan 2,3-dioxygenase, partial [Planctomycetaceae bacterium]|nr:tryptophan 2,3-dioxygenase [Planctomycetaceae bacterium]
MANEQLDYLGYLKIKQLTSCQELESARHGEPAHIEMLYIIVHQAYELWFKEILHELESVIAMFDADNVNEKNMGIAVARLRRITSIQRVLIEQINVLETMTP